MKNFNHIGLQIPDILLPREGIDLHKWAVIACDQFTSEPEYWQKVESIVGDAPSTLNLVLPEVYLENDDVPQRVQKIQQTMRDYLEQGIFTSREGIIYVERTVDGKTRKGIVVALDLEHYDYNKGATSLIRATEGTILERLPPRMKIREGAPLEFPHILVLIDDPEGTVIEPLSNQKERLTPVYDFDLMLGSGHLSGYAVQDAELERGVVAALENLAQPEAFAAKYGLPADTPVLLYAMGDGNHSLATAKAIWEKIKPQVGMNHPARYALVEIENVHDDGLLFEPIHRVLFNLQKDIFAEMQAWYGENYAYRPAADEAEMHARVKAGNSGRHVIGVVSPQGFGTIEIANPTSNLPVGTLQAFLDAFLKQGGAEKIDYVHGDAPVTRLGSQPGNIGFFLPGMDKSDLFKTVILDGALPRKTFSMGEAHEKRFYMEARRIA
ncbi:MAG: DUF1015 domain-containing protein [Anaerolineae bacterium]|nr:MAG: DUF1015 domain-containing protein [Anaerolineae bacterium]